MATYYKIAGASEPASYTWTAGFNSSGGITRLTGVDINQVVDVFAGNQGWGADPTVTATAPTVTTTYADDIVINFFGSLTSLASPYFTEQTGVTPPLTPLYEYNTPTPGGSVDYPSIAAYDWTKTPAGATGTRTCSLTKRTSGVWWVTQTVTFKAAPTVEFHFPNSWSITETNTGTGAQVDLFTAAEGPIAVNYTVTGTATPGTDYTIEASPLAFAAGSSVGVIDISILQDSLYEADETVIITLTSASGAILEGRTTFTLTITNDDGPVPTPAITTGASTTGVSPVNYAFPPPDTAQQLQILKPGGTVAGDFLLAAIARQGTVPYSPNPSIVPPDGWTLIRETRNSSNEYLTSLTVATYYKIAGSNEPSIYTWGIPFVDGNAGYRASGGITRYTGVNLTNPVDTSNYAIGNLPTSTGSVTVPNVYPNYPNDKIVSVIATNYTMNDITAPAGMTERCEVDYGDSPNSFDHFWPSTAMSDMNWLPATGTGERDNTGKRQVAG